VALGADYVKVVEDRATMSAKKCSPKIVVCSNVLYDLGNIRTGY